MKINYTERKIFLYIILVFKNVLIVSSIESPDLKRYQGN